MSLRPYGYPMNYSDLDLDLDIDTDPDRDKYPEALPPVFCSSKWHKTKKKPNGNRDVTKPKANGKLMKMIM